MIFPAIAASAFTVELIFAVSQIITSESVGRDNQGATGSLVGTLLSYGLSTGLGVAGTVEVYTNDGGRKILEGYRHALYLAVGLAAVGLTRSLLFLRVSKSTKKEWDGEGHGQGPATP